jgi:endonuclease/exonuclease/phosphatase family metal-dependent hydrolase
MKKPFFLKSLKQLYLIFDFALILLRLLIMLMLLPILLFFCTGSVSKIAKNTDTGVLMVRSVLVYISTATDKNAGSVFCKSDFSVNNTICLDWKNQINFLTQNTMLIPFGFVAPSFKERTELITGLLPDSDFNIIGLQEVFWDRAQNKILDSWYKSENLFQKDLYLLNSIKDISGLNQAVDVTELSFKQNKWGIEILNVKPSGNNKTAKISFGPYYVLGPDVDKLKFFKQDSGLMILSRFPIIAISAFSFSNASGSDKLANKGVVYARIKVGEGQNDYIHFFNTHLQSHSYPETRFKNLKELFEFVGNIISDDYKNYKDSYTPLQINPVIIVGDLNVKADMPEGWIKKAGIVAAPQNSLLPDDTDIFLNNTEDYEIFTQFFKDFSNSINSDLAEFNGNLNPIVNIFELKDLWQELYPEEPGFTWMGRDWRFGTDNPFGSEGNTYAIENGPPERIDYIFYFGGSSDLKITPLSISLFPKSSAEEQISDHLGLQSSFKLN